MRRQIRSANSSTVVDSAVKRVEVTAYLLTGHFVLVDALDLESPIGERESEWKTDVTAASHDRDIIQ